MAFAEGHLAFVVRTEKLGPTTTSVPNTPRVTQNRYPVADPCPLLSQKCLGYFCAFQLVLEKLIELTEYIERTDTV